MARTACLTAPLIPLGVGGLVKSAVLAGSLSGVCAAPAAAQCGDATYEAVFVAEWSQATHPVMFPPNPHFSPLVGGTHAGSVSFWAPGGLASPGIESMAETGATTLLRAEVQDAIDDATAGSVLLGGSIAVSPGQRSMVFDIGPDHPLVTLVTMIAPSPDWFVGVHGLSLRDGGRWVGSLSVDLWAYDAGTDSGLTYTASNSDTNPQEPIRNLSGEAPFAGAGRIGTLTFTRMPATGCDAADLAEPCGVRDFFDIAAFLALYNAGDPGADFASPFGTLNFFDVSAFLTAFIDGCP
jgi:hypothetical protein